LCRFTLEEILKKLIEEKPTSETVFVYSKVVEISLKLLYKSWKSTLLQKWADHQKFRKQVISLVDLVVEKYP